MNGSTRRGTGVVLLAVWLGGCVTWRDQPVTPQQYIADGRPDKVRLVLNDSTVMTMRAPRILRDSVVGDQDVGNTNRRVAVPVADVLAVQTGSLNLGKTALMGASVVGGTILLILLADASGNRVYY